MTAMTPYIKTTFFLINLVFFKFRLKLTRTFYSEQASDLCFNMLIQKPRTEVSKPNININGAMSIRPTSYKAVKIRWRQYIHIFLLGRWPKPQIMHSGPKSTKIANIGCIINVC